MKVLADIDGCRGAEQTAGQLRSTSSPACPAPTPGSAAGQVRAAYSFIKPLSYMSSMGCLLNLCCRWPGLPPRNLAWQVECVAAHRFVPQSCAVNCGLMSGKHATGVHLAEHPREASSLCVVLQVWGHWCAGSCSWAGAKLSGQQHAAAAPHLHSGLRTTEWHHLRDKEASKCISKPTRSLPWQCSADGQTCSAHSICPQPA